MLYVCIPASPLHIHYQSTHLSQQQVAGVAQRRNVTWWGPIFRQHAGFSVQLSAAARVLLIWTSTLWSMQNNPKIVLEHLSTNPLTRGNLVSKIGCIDTAYVYQHWGTEQEGTDPRVSWHQIMMYLCQLRLLMLWSWGRVPQGHNPSAYFISSLLFQYQCWRIIICELWIWILKHYAVQYSERSKDFYDILL